MNNFDIHNFDNDIQEKLNIFLQKRSLLSPGVWRDLLDAAAWDWLTDELISDKSELKDELKKQGINPQETETILRQEEVLEQLTKPGCPFWSAFPESFQTILPRSVRFFSERRGSPGCTEERFERRTIKRSTQTTSPG